MRIGDWSSDVCSSDLKPVTEKDLVSALNRTEELQQVNVVETAPEEKARIAVIGSRGGVGSSTFAVNLAWILAEERKYKTRSEEHTYELQSLMRNTYAVFCLKKKNHTIS